MKGRDVFAKRKGTINCAVAIIKILPTSFRYKLLSLYKLKCGKVSIGIRYLLLKSLNSNIGDNVSIHENVTLLSLNGLSIGSNVSIHPNCYLDASGGITIGNNVSIATSSILISESHTWDAHDIPIKYNPMKRTPIIIDDDVWLGCNVKVIGPTHLGGRTICAAGAVVKGEVKGHCIVGGIPAKVIKQI